MSLVSQTLAVTMLLAWFMSAPEDVRADSIQNSRETTSPRKKKKRIKKIESDVYYSSLGAGKTLPEGYFRFRLVNKFSQGDRKINADGSAENIGFKLTTAATAIALEYGMSEALSFQLLVPYLAKNSIAFSSREFKASATFAASKARNEALLYQKMQKTGQCANLAACKTLAQTSTPLAAGSELVLPTGERIDFSGKPANAVLGSIPDVVTKAAAPAEGEVGLSDIDFGITYAMINARTQILSTGLGIRIPAGPFENVPAARRPPGQGLMLMGLRMNYDLQPTPALWLSFQHQAEIMIAEGKRQKSSILNPDQLNQADPTTEEAIEAGSNGDPNLQSVSRKGIGHTGFLRFDYGLTDLSRALQPLALEGALNYEYGAEPFLGSTKVSGSPQRYTVAYGAKFDGLGLQRPFPGYVRILRDRFISGKNIPIATSSFIIEFAYYKSF